VLRARCDRNDGPGKLPGQRRLHCVEPPVPIAEEFGSLLNSTATAAEAVARVRSRVAGTARAAVHGHLAEFPGELAAAGEVDSIALGFEPAEFVLPKKKVVLGFDLSAAIGSALDPGKITLSAESRKNKIKVSAQRIDVATGDNTSFLAAQAIPDASSDSAFRRSNRRVYRRVCGHGQRRVH
jgi:hypothetical protein